MKVKQIIEYNGKTIQLPFDINDEYLKTDQVDTANHFSGETTSLPLFAKAVRDTILGAEFAGNHATMRKGLNWFQKHFAKEYMILLD